MDSQRHRSDSSPNPPNSPRTSGDDDGSGQSSPPPPPVAAPQSSSPAPAPSSSSGAQSPDGPSSTTSSAQPPGVVVFTWPVYHVLPPGTPTPLPSSQPAPVNAGTNVLDAVAAPTASPATAGVADAPADDPPEQLPDPARSSIVAGHGQDSQEQQGPDSGPGQRTSTESRPSFSPWAAVMNMWANAAGAFIQRTPDQPGPTATSGGAQPSSPEQAFQPSSGDATAPALRSIQTNPATGVSWVFRAPTVASPQTPGTAPHPSDDAAQLPQATTTPTGAPAGASGAPTGDQQPPAWLQPGVPVIIFDTPHGRAIAPLFGSGGVFQMGPPPPPPPQPNPELTKRYVANLERADAEIRARMRRVGMGSEGCGVCLNEYGDGDGDGDGEIGIVALPRCHHLLHASCLASWLDTLAPSNWSCPYCRDDLSPPAPAPSRPSTAAGGRGGADASADAGDLPTPSSSSLGKRKSRPDARGSLSLHEEVRSRERKAHIICDDPTCESCPLPSAADLPVDPSTGIPRAPRPRTLTLSPCAHSLHPDCLLTSLRVSGYGDMVTEAVEEHRQALLSRERLTMDKVRNHVALRCPACRKECFVAREEFATAMREAMCTPEEEGDGVGAAPATTTATATAATAEEMRTGQ